tara:strand:+ start:638 stop:847 length:210 start_codon:yes stop_codon:yes gene_type:complete
LYDAKQLDDALLSSCFGEIAIHECGKQQQKRKGFKQMLSRLHRIVHWLQSRSRLRCTLCGDLIQNVVTR